MFIFYTFVCAATFFYMFTSPSSSAALKPTSFDWPRFCSQSSFNGECTKSSMRSWHYLSLPFHWQGTSLRRAMRKKEPNSFEPTCPMHQVLHTNASSPAFHKTPAYTEAGQLKVAILSFCTCSRSGVASPRDPSFIVFLLVSLPTATLHWLAGWQILLR